MASKATQSSEAPLACGLGGQQALTCTDLLTLTFKPRPLRPVSFLSFAKVGFSTEQCMSGSRSG